MPQLLIHQSPAIGIWKITEPWQDMLEILADKTRYADDVLKIQSDSRKGEWLAVRLLVQGLTGDKSTIRYKENGAPYLDGALYNISISHTKGFAAVILSNHPRPGIDIEYPSGRALKLCTKYLNTKEMELFDANPCAQHATVATLCWCAKETAYKTLQESGTDFIQHLHITPFSLSEKGVILLKETKTPQQETYHIHYRKTDDYILTWKS